MSEAPLIGSPVSISTNDDGTFSVEFAWATAPDTIWLKTFADLLRRSGRTTLAATSDGLTLTFNPAEADAALDEMAVLLEDAGRQYTSDLEQREAALEHVREALETRYGAGQDVPVRQT
ncbi:MAG TPA: hypothetical protein VIY72_14670 [Acidimicrobiales bacterium]